MSAKQRCWHLATTAVPEVWLVMWWLGCVWINYAVACHRWTATGCSLSLTLSAAAALTGWQKTRRAADRYDDAWLGDLLAPVEHPAPWALFVHPAQEFKREHMAHCYRRWGVTTRTSGWVPFRSSWRADAIQAAACLALVVHAWWLGL